MKVICKQKTSKNFDLKEVTTISNLNFVYDLILEKEYIVMGLSINKDTNCLYYLIDDDHRPFWYPYLLFIISDNRLSSDWSITVHKKENISDIFTLIGFYELCNNEDFHDSSIKEVNIFTPEYFN